MREMLSTRKQVVETKTARLSYALGIVNGLERDVKEGKRREEERRREELRRAQNASKKDKPYHQDGDSDNDGCDEEGIAHCQTTKKTDEICNSVITNEEANSNAIASDVLKSEKIKVRSSRKLKTIALNRNAYDKGVIDSKEIDLNQQAIK
ncbi:hypothetical protein ACHAW5_003207 [Stephanodiscus triporus]|uniref:Uncharacterized protein n=1 Tax=Stephanodiscus triporus TaxID=2934178 RepID=A0ABD3P9F3_9STRA